MAATQQEILDFVGTYPHGCSLCEESRPRYWLVPIGGRDEELDVNWEDLDFLVHERKLLRNGKIYTRNFGGITC